MENGKQPIHFFASEALGQTIHDGLTKREYFAGLAMNAFIVPCFMGTNDIDFIAGRSVQMADALLAELDKPVNP